MRLRKGTKCWYTRCRRLCGSWSFQRRDHLAPCMLETAISPTSTPYPWEPRVSRCDPVVRVLYRVCSEIRQCQRLALFYRHVRLSHTERSDQWPNLLCPRWPFALHPLDRSDQDHWPVPGDSTRRPYGRSSLVRPRHRTWRVLALSARSRLYFRCTGGPQVPRGEQHVPHPARTSIMPGRISGTLRRPAEYCLECAKLLLPVW